MMDQLVKSPDFTWAMSKVFIWSCCEPFVGIVCACLPTYAPLVRIFWRKAGSSYENYGSASGHLDKRRGMVSTATRGGDVEAEFRGDDEIELTVEAAETDQQPASSSSSATAKTATREQPVGIMVRKDFSWESSS
jgi:hypothetical protein